ncbi:hypothetical protein [Nonomuraea sp. NPDC049400]|uniref:hypothetical protein n=1 Tax=Nonomuraea sp. NPDC049400 TaxID=3364352 RepID=UPI0037BAE433
MRWFWLLLGVLIAAATAAASVANIRAGRGDVADWLWLALAAGYTVWTCWHLSHLPSRPRPYQSVGHQRLALSEDRDPVEDFIADALRYEADQQMLRRGGRLNAPDVHDVFPEEG